MFITITRRQIVTAVAVLALAVTGGVGTVLSREAVTASAAADWGLSFPAEGQPPAANASAAELAAYNAYYVGDTTQKRLYLTFDAGYENGYTPAILDALKKHGVPAAFFVVGHYLESAPDLVRRMVAEGHTVANHTDRHPDMGKIGDKAAFLRELTAAEEKYKAVTGQEMPKFYRPPQGKYSIQNLQIAHEAGYATFFWSLAYVDWMTDKQPTRQQAFDKLLGRVHNGAVVLLHSTSSTNAEILDELLAKWKEMGYSFGTLSELCGT